ncbi:hypothetical protein EV645_3459 [Kribbella rubisoli]|uniref:Uncharacterized protein n=1 Tax=Kribbella rubisoli TaxID=3075929 RepID=A0A4Q7X038_9ACTN|nr:hypothetical protein EV645_3459 [Kribbella rubisoli]
MDDAKSGTSRGGTSWPTLRAAQDFECDGRNPLTDRVCVLGHHQGFHRDEVGAEWLDDGTENFRPDWLKQRPYDPRD